MSRRVNDAWVWLGLGVTLFVGYKCVVHTLRYLVEHIEVDDSAQDVPHDGFAMVEQINEISSESLRVLATCQNVNIRKAATRIFLDRVLTNKATVNQILHDFESTNEENRHRAENALQLFYTDEYTMPNHIRAQLPHALRRHFGAREDLEVFRGSRWTLSSLRGLLHSTANEDISLEDAENLLNFLQDNMGELSLTSEELREFQTLREHWPDILSRLRHGDTTDEQARPRPRRRLNDGSPQEQARRRRRREAMVLNEGDHPLGQQDIFQRRRTEEAVPRG